MQLLRRIGFLRRNMAAWLIVMGVLLLGYVGVEYGQMWWSQRQLEHRWAAQQQQIDAERAAGQAVVDDGLTRLSIPKIELSAVVVEGTGRKQLLLGPGHMKETAAPGESGNSVITAHRDTFFRHIHELQKGDQVMLQRSGKTFVYEVTSKRVVDPTETSVVKQTADARLTLITCYPTYYIGPAPERLVVTGKLLGDAATGAARNGIGSAKISVLPQDSSASAGR